MATIRPTFLLFTLLLSVSGLFAGNIEGINWKDEIDGLKRELSARHADLFHSCDSSNFNKALDGVLVQSEGKSVLEMGLMLQQVVATLGDPHTRINFNFHIDKELILPFNIYWFEEGLFVMNHWMDYENLAGKRLVSINGFPVQEVIDSLSTLISGISPSLMRNSVPRMITWTQVLQYFGFAGKSENSGYEIVVEDPEGISICCVIHLPAKESEHVSAGPALLPLGWQDQKSYFWYQYFPGEKLYYIQYNKCWSREAEEDFGSGASALFMPLFREFEKEVLKTVKKLEIDKLVIDMRFNSGGSSLQGSSFVKKLKKTKIDERAGIYLVVGRKTFSSAIINSVDLIKAFDPVIVGENSGGKPNHFGEVNRFVLTTSNLIVSYSTKYFTLLDEDPAAIIPDLPAPQTFEGFMTGRDAAMEAIRDHSRPFP